MSRVEQSTKLELERIIFIGRTFEEYLDMFSLSVEELKGKRILDCPAGACSFTAVGNNEFGLAVTACDIAYYHSSEDLKNKGLQDMEHVMKSMEKAKNPGGVYRDNDADAAHRVRERDAELDAQYTGLFRELLTYMMEDARSITPCTHLLFMAKNIERIGDHATNIAENVWYPGPWRSHPAAPRQARRDQHRRLNERRGPTFVRCSGAASNGLC